MGIGYGAKESELLIGNPKTLMYTTLLRLLNPADTVKHKLSLLVKCGFKEDPTDFIKPFVKEHKYNMFWQLLDTKIGNVGK